MRWVVFLYPWMELWSLLALGSRTSAGMALLWVLAAGVLGVMLIRVAGAQTLGQLRTAQQSGSLQAQLLQDHVALAIVGLLLLIPGMVSDALAVLLLIRPLRSLIYRSVAPSERFSEEFSGGFRHTHHTHHTQHTHEGDEGVTLEGEYEQVGTRRVAPPSSGSGEPPQRRPE